MGAKNEKAEGKDTLEAQLAAATARAEQAEQREAEAKVEAAEAEVKAAQAEAKVEAAEGKDGGAIAIMDHRTVAHKANERAFEKAEAARVERCKVPLTPGERKEWRGLEERATRGADLPGPADMRKLGEYRIRATLSEVE